MQNLKAISTTEMGKIFLSSATVVQIIEKELYGRENFETSEVLPNARKIYCQIKNEINPGSLPLKLYIRTQNKLTKIDNEGQLSGFIDPNKCFELVVNIEGLVEISFVFRKIFDTEKWSIIAQSVYSNGVSTEKTFNESQDTPENKKIIA